MAGMWLVTNAHSVVLVWCGAGKEVLTSRELDGKLYAGHETFDWLLAVISYVLAAEVCLAPKRLRGHSMTCHNADHVCHTSCACIWSSWQLAVVSALHAERPLNTTFLPLHMQKSLKKGDCLWELIAPRDKDGLPARSPSGRYRVKLFLLVRAI